MMSESKILAISNDSALLGFLQQNFGEDGYQLVSTQHTEELLIEVLGKESPDLIILDIVMPNLAGIETCLRIRQWSGVPIMMLSVWGAGKDKVRGLDLGADSYLTEPFGIDELTARIERALQRNYAAMTLQSDIGSCA